MVVEKKKPATKKKAVKKTTAKKATKKTTAKKATKKVTSSELKKASGGKRRSLPFTKPSGKCLTGKKSGKPKETCP